MAIRKCPECGVLYDDSLRCPVCELKRRQDEALEREREKDS